ncbi:MAG: hypothetical protein P8M30_16635 [Planctomycetaceae bacterium]|nr:hypothetical protein [Planctomycetaceae bacterium]
MSSNQQSDLNPRQHYNELSDEIADILLGPDSPVRGSTEFNELIADHDRLQSRQAELQALDAKLVKVLPGLEQTEAQFAAAEKQLAAEKKTLADFAGELGKAAFAGLRAGELPDNPLFADRKALQSRIETLQRQKTELVAGENAGMMEKAKIQAQQLKLAGQIKVEELKIGSADRALGQALLTSKEKPPIQCDQTEEVLQAIADQRQQVTIANEKVEQAEAAVADRKSAGAETLGRSRLHDAASLKSELKEVRKEQRQNEKRITSIRSSVVATGLTTESLRELPGLTDMLSELTNMKQERDARKSQWQRRIDDLSQRFCSLPHRAKYTLAGTAAIIASLTAFSFIPDRDSKLALDLSSIPTAPVLKNPWSMTSQDLYRHELSNWEYKSKLIIDGIRKEKLLEELSDVSLSQHSGLLKEERKRLENIQRTCKNQLSELIASFQGISTEQNDKELINTQRQTLINKIDEALNTILVARRESAKKVSATIELDFANKTRPLLTNEMRKQLIEIAKQSERVKIPLPKGSLSKLSASNPLHAEYVIEVCRQNPIKDLPRDRVAWFLSFLGKIDNQDAQQELLSILAEITDSSVVTESVLSTPETRAAVLQIPGPWNDKLKDMLGRAYLHEPRLDHAKFFDKVATEQIPELGDVSRTDFKLLLAAGVSGSKIAKERLLELYTNEEVYSWASDDLKRLHLLGGALMAEHSSADVRVLTKIAFAIFRYRILSNQFSDFLTGWYGVAQASYLDDATELYLAVESNKRQSRLRNLADQIGQFPSSNEGLRISTIAFLDRVASGRIPSLVDLDNSPYHSVSVFALSKMIQNGQIASANGQAIANKVIDPWRNIASDPNTRIRSVADSEWKFYVDALVSHDKEAAVPVLLKTFLGETKVRTSLGAFQTVDGEYTRTEINTYGFRAYAAKQATALSKKAAAEILNYGVSDDCPSELRSLALSVAVVSGLPLTSEQKNKLVSRYSESSTNSSRAIQYEKGLVLGLLRLLGEQLQYEEIRREPVETIWGLSDVAWWSGDKNLLSITEKCREYRGLNLASRERIETSRMPVWTPYHLASEKQLDAVLKKIGDQNAGGDFNTQSILDRQTSIWRDTELTDIASGLTDIRTKVSEENQNRFNHNASIPSFSAWVEFEKNPTCKNAENALRSGVAGIAEKDLMLVNSALAIVRRDSETREHAIRTVSIFVDATDFKGIDRDLSRVWRAKVLAQVFDSLLEINKSLRNIDEYSKFNRTVVGDIMSFIDVNSD